MNAISLFKCFINKPSFHWNHKISDSCSGSFEVAQIWVVEGSNLNCDLFQNLQSQSMPLIVKPISADLVKDFDFFGKSDPYAIILIGNEKQRSRTCSGGGKRPSWTDTFQFNTTDQLLRVQVYDDDFGKDDFIGEGSVNLAQFYSNPFRTENEYIDLINKGKSAGRILLSIEFQGQGGQGGWGGNQGGWGGNQGGWGGNQGGWGGNQGGWGGNQGGWGGNQGGWGGNQGGWGGNQGGWGGNQGGWNNGPPQNNWGGNQGGWNNGPPNQGGWNNGPPNQGYNGPNQGGWGNQGPNRGWGNNQGNNQWGGNRGGW